MLLAVDIGNTNVVLGLFEGADLRADYRIETRASRTADELATMAGSLFDLGGRRLAEVKGGIISSVVPPATGPMDQFFRRYLKVDPLLVGPGLKTGMPVLTDNPREVGADRIVNAVAAFDRFRQGVVVVDFGTATTFDVVTDRGEYAGGVIAPGLAISAEALYSATAKLPRVEIARPGKVVGKSTVTSIQAGLVYGYAGMVDALVARIRAEIGGRPRVVATGGLASLVARESTEIEECDELLTLRGLRLLYERNRE